MTQVEQPDLVKDVHAPVRGIGWDDI